MNLRIRNAVNRKLPAMKVTLSPLLRQFDFVFFRHDSAKPCLHGFALAAPSVATEDVTYSLKSLAKLENFRKLFYHHLETVLKWFTNFIIASFLMDLYLRWRNIPVGMWLNRKCKDAKKTYKKRDESFQNSFLVFTK